MARSTKYAALICTVCSIFTLAGIFAGWYWRQPVIVVFALLPAVIYEIYRTEGVSTIWASWGMLAVLIAEAVFLIGKFNINISQYAAKFYPNLPEISITLAGPAIMAYFSYILIRRTAGVYTKWLAAIILIGSVGLFYILDPSIFSKFADMGIKEGIKNLPVK